LNVPRKPRLATSDSVSSAFRNELEADDYEEAVSFPLIDKSRMGQR